MDKNLYNDWILACNAHMYAHRTINVGEVKPREEIKRDLKEEPRKVEKGQEKTWSTTLKWDIWGRTQKELQWGKGVGDQWKE